MLIFYNKLFCSYEPTTELALDAYVSRMTNPVRHIAKEVHRMSMYPEPAHKYVGKYTKFEFVAILRFYLDRYINNGLNSNFSILFQLKKKTTLFNLNTYTHKKHSYKIVHKNKNNCNYLYI